MKMKKIQITDKKFYFRKAVRVFTALSFCAVAFTGCEFLQGSLSSVQQEKLLEATGFPEYEYKVWYYNGTSGENMQTVSDSSDNEYSAQSLKIDFGQKVAYKSYSPSGKMTVNYTDAQGNSISKTIPSVSGKLSPDYESFYIDMTPVTKVIDGITTSATVDLKLSGFVCAAGEQSGRPVKALELKSLQVRPLYSKLSFSYSTVGFSTQSRFRIPLKGAFSLENGSYNVTAKDSASNEYTFKVSSEGDSIYLTPTFSSKPADQTAIKLTLKGILAEGSGESYSKDFDIKFMKHLIVIDGLEDSNWDSDYALSVSDSSGDSFAKGADGEMYAASADLTKLAVTNDDDNLYIAIKGGLSSSWGDGFALMLSKDHSSVAAYTEGAKVFKLADSMGYGRENLAHGKPDLYIYHKPQDNSLGAWVEDGEGAADISSFVQYAEDSSETFIEYAIPLAKLSSAGITQGEKIYVGAFFSAHWDAGIFAADAVPDAIISSSNESHSSIILNFKNGLEYKIK